LSAKDPECDWIKLECAVGAAHRNLDVGGDEALGAQPLARKVSREGERLHHIAGSRRRESQVPHLKAAILCLEVSSRLRVRKNETRLSE